MNNFLEYIKEDIELKRGVLKKSPLKTKKDQKKYIELLDEYSIRYNSYLKNVDKYIQSKAKSLTFNDIKVDNFNIEEVNERISSLNNVAKILYPYNTYYEKLGFDVLLYNLENFSSFDFVKVNETIKEISDIFKKINVELTEDDFKITPYVHEYMKAFYIESANVNPNYFSLQNVFERIYWKVPNLIKHIVLNFRMIMTDNKDTFNKYILALQGKIKDKYNFTDYNEVVEELSTLYYNYTHRNKLSLNLIMDLHRKGDIKLPEYFSGSKMVDSAYNTIFIQDDSRAYDEGDNILHVNLVKLKTTLSEYQKYVYFIPFVEVASKTYKEYALPKSHDEIVASKDNLLYLIDVTNRSINGDVKFLEKKKIKKKQPEFFNKSQEEMRANLVNYADKLNEVYMLLDSEKFNKSLSRVMNDLVTVLDLISVYREYDFFKKRELGLAFDTTSYEEVEELTSKFNDFCNNVNNKVISSIKVNEEYDIIKVIVDKFRILNINLSEESMKNNKIDTIIENINILLLLNYIKKCDTTPEKMWFFLEAEKIREEYNKN